ncbi:MAG TPA: DUF3153 domain-containing protein [Geminocystis sp. M7585_C2015_104]|nr:DUF3153 domain-containing protein [Geminocystis sp. M7585_C2015_104]
MKRLLLFLSLLILLSGCVRYDVGIRFPQANGGEIVQHVKLGQQLVNFSGEEVNEWLKSIEQRASSLNGRSKRLNDYELVVAIPFYNGKELVEKFNEFFASSPEPQKIPKKNPDYFNLSARMNLEQNNWLFLERNVLEFEADLTPLALVSKEGNIIISGEDLMDLRFKLNIPLLVKIAGEGVKWQKTGNQEYEIRLSPGKINRIKAVFWVPNYVGLGTMAIIIFVSLGYYLKYKKMPLLEGTREGL